MQRTTKIYNYWIKFKDKSGREWKEEGTRHAWSTNRKIIDKALDDELSILKDQTDIKPIRWGIMAKDFSTMSIIGKLQDNGVIGEGFDIKVGDKSITDYIFNRYNGNKVRITMQILED